LSILYIFSITKVGLETVCSSPRALAIPLTKVVLPEPKSPFSPTMVALSPFFREKIYKIDNEEFDHLIHIDAYRLDSGEELLNLGWEEITKDPKNLIFLEWPERVEDIIPKGSKSYREINFKFIDENTREISHD